MYLATKKLFTIVVVAVDVVCFGWLFLDWHDDYKLVDVWLSSRRRLITHITTGSPPRHRRRRRRRHANPPFEKCNKHEMHKKLRINKRN